VSVSVWLPAEHAAWLTATGELLISAVKSNALTVLHARGWLKVAVTAVLPGVAVIELKVGAVVSTVSARVSVGEIRLPVSTARKLKLCCPSPSGEGLNVQVADGLPQPEQLTPIVENAAPSTLASTLAMEALCDVAVPEYVGVVSKVAVPFGRPLTVSEGVRTVGVVGGMGTSTGTGSGVGVDLRMTRIRCLAARQLLRSRRSLTRRVSSAQATKKKMPGRALDGTVRVLNSLRWERGLRVVMRKRGRSRKSPLPFRLSRDR
jgi:hypothetical protein